MQNFDLLRSYWSSKLGNGRLPRYEDFDPAEVKELLPFLMLYDVHNEPKDYIYRLVGGAVRKVMHRNLVGEKLSVLAGKGPESQVWRNLERAKTNQQPIECVVPYAGGAIEAERIEYIITPWSRDGSTFDLAILCIDVPERHGEVL